MLLRFGLAPIPLPNIDAADDVVGQILDILDLEGLILTGGNDLVGLGPVVGSEASSRRDNFERIAISWARANKIPLLAVCRGFQHLNIVLGGDISKATGHAGDTHRVFHVGDHTSSLVDFPGEFLVNSFHNFTIAEQKIAKCLVPLVTDENGCVEAAVHVSEPLLGIMWHPERSSPAEEIDRSILKSLFGA